MPRRVVLFISIAAAAFTLGVLVLTGRSFGTEATSTYPAPARVPVVVGLTKDQAVRRIEAAHLKPVVRYKRLRSVRHGRIIAMQVTNLLHAPRLPLISLEGTPVIVSSRAKADAGVRAVSGAGTGSRARTDQGRIT